MNSNKEHMKIFKISGVMKEYPWGSSKLIQSLVQGKDNITTKKEKLIGELWFGTHPNGPSLITHNISLDELLKENPFLLGKHLTFPFLLKVMAIEKPLSIQVHPTTEQAISGYNDEAQKRLSTSSEYLNYQDSNEKAEMLYALSPMTAMLGFRNIKEIQCDLKRLIPTYYQHHFSHCEDISSIFHTLYTMNKQELTILIDEYKRNLKKDYYKKSSHRNFLTSVEIALTAIEDYGVDPGVFAPFLLNVVYLNEGESIYLMPQIIHAYVKGEGIELMTNSDNILRAGLTTKHIDVEELMKIMIAKETKVRKLTTIQKISGTHINTPNEIFELAILENGNFTITDNLLSIILVTEGSATISSGEENITLSKGMSVFIPPSQGIFTIITDGVACRAIGK